MARNPDNIWEEDPNFNYEGLIYNFTVDEFLKGGHEETNIHVILDYKVNGVIHEKYIKPESNKKMVLFLSYNEPFDRYFGVMEPFRFEVGNSKVIVKSNAMEGAITHMFDRVNLPFSEFKSEINKIDLSKH